MAPPPSSVTSKIVFISIYLLFHLSMATAVSSSLPFSDSDDDYELIGESQRTAKVPDSSPIDIVDSQEDSQIDAETRENVDTSPEEQHPETISEAPPMNDIEDSLNQSKENQERRGNEEVTLQEEEEEAVAAPRRIEWTIKEWIFLGFLVLLLSIDHFADQRAIAREKNLTQTYEQQIQKHQLDLAGMKRLLREMQMQNFTSRVEISAKDDEIEFLKNHITEMIEESIKETQNYDEKIRHSNNLISVLHENIETITQISKKLEAQLKKMKNENEAKNVELADLKKEKEDRKKEDEQYKNEPFRTVSMPLARNLGFTVTGTFVSAVKEGGIAFLNSGLREGDQIFSVNEFVVGGVSTRSITDLIDDVRAQKPNPRRLRMVVRNNRNGLTALEKVFNDQDEFAKRKRNK